MHSVYWQLLVIIPTRTPVDTEEVLDKTLLYQYTNLSVFGLALT